MDELADVDCAVVDDAVDVATAAESTVFDVDSTD